MSRKPFPFHPTATAAGEDEAGAIISMETLEKFLRTD